MSEDAHDDAEKSYSTIRELLGDFIGCTLVDVTQHDFSDWQETGKAFLYLHFSNGRSMYVEVNGEDEPNFMYDEDDETTA